MQNRIQRADCVSGIQPTLPDPGNEDILFFAWIKKRGTVCDLRKCELKWSRKGLDVQDLVARYGAPIISIRMSGKGEEVVWLEDKVWADQWMIFHRREVPHHTRLKPISSMDGNIPELPSPAKSERGKKYPE